MIKFQTLEETRVNEVVAALEKMQDGAAVSAKRIGEAVEMGHHQTLTYLHIVSEKGRTKPASTHNSDLTRGWVPGNVDASMSLADERATLVADTMARLYEGKPLSGRPVAEEMERPIGPAGRWLAHAETLCLASRTDTHRGWIPESR